MATAIEHARKNQESADAVAREAILKVLAAGARKPAMTVLRTAQSKAPKILALGMLQSALLELISQGKLSLDRDLFVVRKKR